MRRADRSGARCARRRLLHRQLPQVAVRAQGRGLPACASRAPGRCCTRRSPAGAIWPATAGTPASTAYTGRIDLRAPAAMAGHARHRGLPDGAGGDRLPARHDWPRRAQPLPRLAIALMHRVLPPQRAAADRRRRRLRADGGDPGAARRRRAAAPEPVRPAPHRGAGDAARRPGAGARLGAGLQQRGRPARAGERTERLDALPTLRRWRGGS